VTAYKNTNSSSQVWGFNGGFIVNRLTGYVLDINGGNLNAGETVILWAQKPSDQATNQQWSYNSTTQVFTSVAAPLVLDVNLNSGAPVGNPLDVWIPKTPDQNSNQRFELVPIF